MERHSRRLNRSSGPHIEYTFVASNTPSIISMLSQTFRCYILHQFFEPCYFKEIPLALTSFIPALL
jgi:hypothetical protein